MLRLLRPYLGRSELQDKRDGNKKGEQSWRIPVRPHFLVGEPSITKPERQARPLSPEFALFVLGRPRLDPSGMASRSEPFWSEATRSG
jgi:hypothetical protein